uniref:ATP synthase CF0 subunit I n=1 Tax=Juncus gracilicaulis TaxID=511724 RepID=UPI001F1413C5|nr:ATP synthase CF0 subunit I [Juncus gracilicaulis]ULQ66821.1 ATP synthase CF0 subunit I [Juncus gracilicaulis]
MKNEIDSFAFLNHWPLAGSFGLNTDILATNLINLIIVYCVLVFFGKGVLNDLLDNRKQRILSTLRNSEELRRGVIEQLEKARVRFQNVELKANKYRMNGYSNIEQDKQKLIKEAYDKLEQSKNNKNEIFYFEQERAINQIRQRFFQQALQKALKILNNRLNIELHFRTIRVNIGILAGME